MNDEMRITSDEIRLIKATFKDNDELLKLLRKIFLPTFDPKAPLGQTVDLWSVKDISAMAPEDVKVYFLARRELIMHVESNLLQLKSLANLELPDKTEAKKKAALDSAQ